MFYDFVFEDLDFDVDDVVWCYGFVKSIIDVCVQCVQRNVVFVVLFGMCDFSVIYMVSNVYVDILGIYVYCVLNCMFYSVME